MKKIYNGNSKLGGIYKITNINNNKVYIGSAKCFQVRATQHEIFLKRNRHSNKHLQASWNKHGEKAFVFEVLEVVKGSKGERFRVEQNYIERLLQEGSQKQIFNIKKNTVQKERSCSSRTPEETKRKREETNLARYGVKHWAYMSSSKEYIRSKLLGRKRTKEEIKKSAISRTGRKASEEHKRKLSDAWTNKRREDLSKASKKLWTNPEYRIAVISKKTGLKRTMETRQKMRDAKLGKKQTKEHIENARLGRQRAREEKT